MEDKMAQESGNKTLSQRLWKGSTALLQSLGEDQLKDLIKNGCGKLLEQGIVLAPAVLATTPLWPAALILAAGSAGLLIWKGKLSETTKTDQAAIAELIMALKDHKPDLDALNQQLNLIPGLSGSGKIDDVCEGIEALAELINIHHGEINAIAADIQLNINELREQFSGFDNKLDQMHRLLLDYFEGNGNKKIRKMLGGVPVQPEVFIGRDDDIESIHEKLFSGQNCLLLVNGEGGIGKTTIASKYYHKYRDEYSHLIWLVAEKSIEDALLNLSIELQMKFDDNINVRQKIDEILRELMELTPTSLLVIDNANELEDLNKSYPHLRKCSNLHLLLTTRITEFAHAEIYPVKHLNEQDARELFAWHYKEHDSAEDELLNRILEAVGYNTLVIELLAKNLNNFNNALDKKYTLHELLADLQQKGVLGLSKSQKVTTDYKLQPAKPEEIVEAMYDISRLVDEEKAMLSLFAVLPATNIPFAHLKALLPDINDELLLAIAQKGWIEFDCNQKSFKCNPVVQEVARKQNREKLCEHCQTLVSSLISQLDYELYTGTLAKVSYGLAVVYIQYAEMVCKYVYKLKADISVLWDKIGFFHSHYGDLNKALNSFEERSRLDKELYNSNQQDLGLKKGLAVSYERLGSIYSTLGNLEKALIFFEKEKLLFKELYEGNPQNADFKNGLAISYSRLGHTYSSLGKLDKALNLLEEDLKLTQELYEDNKKDLELKKGLATSYSRLGDTYTLLGNLDKALIFFENNFKLVQELHEVDKNNLGFKKSLAISYSKLGHAHILLGNLNKALIYFENYFKLTKELYEADKNNLEFKKSLSISYSRLGDTHTRLGNLDKALNFFENSLNLTNELYDSNPRNVNFKNGLARSYSRLGDTYTLLGNLDKALIFFEESSRLSKELYDSSPQNVNFKNSLAISYEKIGNVHTSLGNWDDALKFFEESLKLSKELCDSDPSNLDFKKELAILYSRLGDTHSLFGNWDKALVFLENDLKLNQELYEADKKNISFKNGLAISYGKLGEKYSTMGDLNKALIFLEESTLLFEELHEVDKKNVVLKNDLAVLYANLGVFYMNERNEKNKTREYFQKAGQLWEALARDFPNHIVFQENWKQINRDLNNL